MNKRKIMDIIKQKISDEFPRFADLPINEEYIGASKGIAKQLGITLPKSRVKLYAFTVVSKDIFRNVLRIVIDENGKFVKISHSK